MEIFCVSELYFFILAGKHGRRRRLSLRNHLCSAKSGNIHINNTLVGCYIFQLIHILFIFDYSFIRGMLRLIRCNFIFHLFNLEQFFPVGNSRHYIIYVPNEASHFTLCNILILHISRYIEKKLSTNLPCFRSFFFKPYMCFQNSLQLIP